jgi:hypothetical protein
MLSYSLEPETIIPIQTLTNLEIDEVCGGAERGFSLANGSSFTWRGPNGVSYDDVTFVGSHYFMFSDGSREYFADIFAVQTYPLPDTQGFVNAIAAAGSPPVYVYH